MSTRNGWKISLRTFSEQKILFTKPKAQIYKKFSDAFLFLRSSKVVEKTIGNVYTKNGRDTTLFLQVRFDNIFLPEIFFTKSLQKFSPYT